jgi:hypothetical protein
VQTALGAVLRYYYRMQLANSCVVGLPD